MVPYIIITDASANINTTLRSKYTVPVVPMSYSLGEDMLESRTDEDKELMKRFYDQQKQGEHTRTSQITSFVYEEFVTPYLEKGMDVLYIALSSGLTGTVESAMVAARNLKEDFPDRQFMVLDSLAAAGGIGILLERALHNQDQGMSLEENYKDVEECTHRIRHWFMVDDLMYLKQGGRISASTAVVGTMLSIKPILKIDEEGHLINISKARGASKAVSIILDLYRENLSEEEAEGTVYLCHSFAGPQMDHLEEGIRKITPKVKICRPILCPIIGAHTGPGLMAVIHLGK